MMVAFDVLYEPDLVETLSEVNAGVIILAILGVAAVCAVCVFVSIHYYKKRKSSK